jgi:nitrite reductase/ring-hydroxylating ferredoxin subunit
MPTSTPLDGFERVAALAEVPEGRGRAFWLGSEKVALYNRRGRIHAFADRCPHMGAALSEGMFNGQVIRCHWHGWGFDAETGRCRQRKWAILPIFDVRIEAGEIFLRRRPLPDAPLTPPPPAGDGDDEPWMTWTPPPPRKTGES